MAKDKKKKIGKEIIVADNVTKSFGNFQALKGILLRHRDIDRVPHTL